MKVNMAVCLEPLTKTKHSRFKTSGRLSLPPSLPPSLLAALSLPRQFARQPEERLLKVVVGLGRDVVVLQVLLAVENNLLRLHLPVLSIEERRREGGRAGSRAGGTVRKLAETMSGG